VPRLLLFVAFVVIVVVWLQRVARVRGSKPARSGPDPNMPKHLICGGCGKQYDPQQSGWICPQCHK
jgi:hypothetical protein